MKPGRLSTAAGPASGSWADVVSAVDRLFQVAPLSVETWTKPKSQPSSVSHSASNVRLGDPAGTVM